MGPNTRKLASTSSQQVAPGKPRVEFSASTRSPAIERELAELLHHKNGFSAFESALHVFPAQSLHNVIGIADWNTVETWKYAYEGRADHLLCFAEDIFANQFALAGRSIVLFHAETSETSAFANSLEDWAQRILEDYDYLAGYTFAHQWQATNGALPATDRLRPIHPFVAGGEYAVGNMRAVPRAEVLRTLGPFAAQIADVPDGGGIRLHSLHSRQGR